MRILHVVPSIHPSFGGPAVSVPSLAAAQAHLGHQVTLAFYAGPPQRSSSSVLDDLPGIGCVQLLGIESSSPWETLSARLAMAKIQPLLDSHCDIVHLHGIWRPLQFRVAKACHRAEVPYVIAPRGMLDPWSLGQRALRKKLALWAGWRGVLDNCHFLHALNQAEKELIRPLSLNCPINIFPNGVFTTVNDTTLTRQEAIVSLGLDPDKVYILFLGRLHYKKGLDYLAEAFASIAQAEKHIDLMVVGPDAGYLATFNQHIKRSKLQNRVHLLGPLYGRQKLTAYAACSCFCLPSRQEGFSMTIIEAMQMGRPVVISEDCHFPEVAQFNAGKVVPLESRIIASALMDILGESADEAMEGNAMALVRERYLWSDVAGNLVKAYQQALSTTGVG